VVGGERHLAHQVRRDEDRAALGREALQQRAHPVNPLGVEPVDRLVEHDGRRVAEQCGGDSEPLPHPQRELPRALLRDVPEADEVDQLVDTRARNPVCLCQSQQVVVGGATGVHRPRFEQRANLV
jgi:hypothetical protein